MKGIFILISSITVGFLLLNFFGGTTVDGSTQCGDCHQPTKPTNLPGGTNVPDSWTWDRPDRTTGPTHPSDGGPSDGGGGETKPGKDIPKHETMRLVQPSGNLTLDPENILGDPFYVQRSTASQGMTILNLDPITVQDTFIANGTLTGRVYTDNNQTLIGSTNVTEWVTGISTERQNGEYSELKGIISTPGGIKATYTGTIFASYDDKGNIIGKGYYIYSSDPFSELGFLNDKIGLAVYKTYANGTHTGKIYEWK